MKKLRVVPNASFVILTSTASQSQVLIRIEDIAYVEANPTIIKDQTGEFTCVGLRSGRSVYVTEKVGQIIDLLTERL